MSKELPQRDILNTSLDTENQLKGVSSTTMRKNIEGTPFYIIKHDGIYFAAMKNSIITPKFKEEEIPQGEEPELYIERYINDHIWDIVVTICVIVHGQIAQEVTKFIEKETGHPEIRPQFEEKELGPDGN